MFELDEHFHVSLKHTVIDYLMRLLQAIMPNILVSDKVIVLDGGSSFHSSTSDGAQCRALPSFRRTQDQPSKDGSLLIPPETTRVLLLIDVWFVDCVVVFMVSVDACPLMYSTSTINEEEIRELPYDV